MIDFKNAKVKLDWKALQANNPYLCSIIYYADLLAAKYGKSVTITSIYRDDNSIHSDMEGVDCRLRHNSAKDLSLAQWSEITASIDNNFEFGGVRHDDISTRICHIRLSELGHHEHPDNDHVHVQARRH